MCLILIIIKRHVFLALEDRLRDECVPLATRIVKGGAGGIGDDVRLAVLYLQNCQCSSLRVGAPLAEGWDVANLLRILLHRGIELCQLGFVVFGDLELGRANNDLGHCHDRSAGSKREGGNF